MEWDKGKHMLYSKRFLVLFVRERGLCMCKWMLSHVGKIARRQSEREACDQLRKGKKEKDEKESKR
jgi:hypothetical protein